MKEYTIYLLWDGEAERWFTESDDIPGLILESDTVDKLIERAKLAAPELLELSGLSPHNIALRFKAERLAVVA